MQKSKLLTRIASEAKPDSAKRGGRGNSKLKITEGNYNNF